MRRGAGGLLGDPRAPKIVRVLLIVSAALYALSPVDLLPDIVPLLGLLDDLAVVIFLVYLAVRRGPEPPVETKTRPPEYIDTVAERADEPGRAPAERPRENPWKPLCWAIACGIGLVFVGVIAGRLLRLR